MNNWNIIKVPCKTGDTIWFLDNNRYVQWGTVYAFTETNIIADSARTEYRKYKEILFIDNWGKTIVLAEDRKEAELLLLK